MKTVRRRLHLLKHTSVVVTLKSGLGVVQGHRKMASIDRLCTTYYRLPL